MYLYLDFLLTNSHSPVLFDLKSQMKQQNFTMTIFLAISSYSSIMSWMSNFTEYRGIIFLILNSENYLKH